MAVKTTDEFVIPISIKEDVKAKIKAIEDAVKGLNNTINKSSAGGGGGLKNTADNAKKVSEELKKSTSAVSIYGTAMSKMGSAVFTANSYLDFFNRTMRTVTSVLGGAVAPAMELEKGLAQLSTVIPDSSVSMKEFGNDILNFQKNFGSKQEDVIRGYYDVLQSGAVDAADATKVMDTAQKMAVAGYTTSDKMIQGLVSVMANYNMTAEDTVRIADLMAISNKNGRVTIEGLAENIGVVAGLAANMNISLEETLSAMSTISMATSNASEAMTSFRAIITGMSTQTGEFSSVMERLGYSSIQAMVAQKGFLGTIRALIKETGSSAEALSNIFGRVEAKQGLIALTAEKTSKVFTRNMSEMEDAAYKVGDVIETQFTKSIGTADQQLNILKATFTATMSEAGLGFMSDLKEFYKSLTGIIDAFGRLTSSIKFFFNETKLGVTIVKSLSDAFGAVGKVSSFVLDVFKDIIDIFPDLARANDQASNTMLLNTNNIYNAAKNLRSEIVNTSANMSEMNDKFRSPSAEEYFSKANRSVKTFNDELAESIAKFGKQTKEMKKVIPEIKKQFIDFKLDLNDVAKYQVFSDDPVNRYKIAIEKAKTALNDLKAKQIEVNKQVNKDPSKREELTKSLKESYNKYREALAEMSKIFSKSVADSLEESEDIYVNIGLQFQPKTAEITKLEKQIKDYMAETESMLLASPVLKVPIEISRADMEEGARNKDTNKGILQTIKSMFTESTNLKDSVSETLKLRAETLKILKEELRTKQMYVEFEKNSKDIAEKGGVSILTTDDLISIRKNLDSPFEKFVTNLSSVLREDLNINKFIDWSNGLTDSIYRGFYLGIQDLKDPLSTFFSSTPQMANVPSMEGSSLASGMSAMSDAMSGLMGGITAAGSIADAIGGAAQTIGGLPQKIADALQAIVDMPKMFIKGLKAIVEVIPKLFTEFIPAMLDAFSELFNLPFKIVDGVFEGLMKLLDSDVFVKLGKALFQFFVGAIPRLAILFIKVVVGVIKLIVKIIKDIPKIVVDLITGVIDAIKEMVNELFKSLGLKELFDIKVALDEKSLGNISEAIKNGSQQMFAVLDADSEKKGTGIMAKILAALDKSGSSLKKITDGLWALWKWVRDKILMPLWKVIVGAWKWTYKNIISKIETVIKKAWLWVWDKVLKPMLNDLKKDFLRLIGNLKSVWIKIYSGLSAVFKPILRVIGVVVNLVIKGISGVMRLIMNILGNIRPLMNFIGKIVSSFGNILSSIPQIISKIIGGFKSFINKIPETIKMWAEKAGKYLTAGFEKVAAFIVKIFANLNIFEYLNQLFDFIKELPSKVSEAFNFVGKLLTDVFNGIISMFKGAFYFIKTIFNGVINAFKTAFNFIETIFNKIVGAFKSVFDFVETIFGKITGAFESVFGVVETMFNKITGAFETVFGVVETMFNAIIKAFETVFNLFTPIVDGIKSVLTSIGNVLKPVLDVFGDVGSKISNAFSSLDLSKLGEDIGSAFMKILNPIIDLFKSIANGIIDLVNGLKIPKTNVHIGMPKGIPDVNFQLFPEIDLIPGDIARFATGGMAMGTDTIPAMLTPGEFVVNRDATSKNIDLLRSINAGREPISSGGSPTFNITINAKTYLDQDAIKREILPTIEKELKRKSLDGSFIIAASGIRK